MAGGLSLPNHDHEEERNKPTRGATGSFHHSLLQSKPAGRNGHEKNVHDAKMFKNTSVVVSVMICHFPESKRFEEILAADSVHILRLARSG